MSAEIAILNKSAVALAADSAVTISSGGGSAKVFDSEDKLFELTLEDPIGVMIHNGMTFMDAPLPVLVKRHRSGCARFGTVAEAADGFLDHLLQYARTVDARARERDVRRALQPLLRSISARVDRAFFARLRDETAADQDELQRRLADLRREILTQETERAIQSLGSRPDASFIGESTDPDGHAESVRRIVEAAFADADEAQLALLYRAAELELSKRVPDHAATGVVVAGFGHKEMFPALVSFELYGMVDGRLRYAKADEVRIGQGDEKARVLPFAQKEMVDRFLYGIDDDIQERFDEFCAREAPAIGEALARNLEFTDDRERDAFRADVDTAVTTFHGDLAINVFGKMRERSRAELDEMIEFMPKAEMARMAEALVNLTSIKRRVTRGLETVAGPVDCAVISEADGFVWVKRKHYFPGELNHRFFERARGRRRPLEDGSVT